MPQNVLSAQINVTAPGASQATNQVSQGLSNVQQSAVAAGRSLGEVSRGVGSSSRQFDVLAAGVNRLGRGMGGLPPALDRLAGGLRNTSGASNQANNSLINLGRVVQDAPFGFLGIANNLNPLLESFQRLRASTGSTGSALRSLGQSLIGPAGIGIALSAVSSLLLVFGDAIFGTAKKIDTAAAANDSLANSLARVAENLDDLKKGLDFGADIRKLDLKIEGLKGPALAIAIAQGKIADNNKLIGESAKELTPFVRQYDEVRIAAQSVVEKFKQLRQEAKTRPFIEATSLKGDASAKKNPAAAQAKEIENLSAAYEEYFKTGKVGDEIIKGLTKTQKQQLATLTTLGDKIKPIANKIIDAQQDIKIQEKTISAERIDLAEDAAKELKKANDKSAQDYKKYVDSVISKAKQLASEFPSLIPVPVIESALLTKQQSFEIASKFISDFNEGLRTGFARKTQGISIDIATIIKPPKAEDIIPRATIEQIAGLSGLFKAFKTPELVLTAEQVSKLQQGFIQMGQAISQVVTPAITEMISAIAEGQNAFKAFGKAIIQIFQAVIAKLIQTAILAAIISVISGGVGNAGKGGLSFIQAFKNVFGGFRAAGGPVTSGQSYIVGEKGPELFTPNTGGSIIPNNAVGASFGSGGGGGTVQLRLAGYDLVAAINLNQLKQGRLV